MSFRAQVSPFLILLDSTSSMNTPKMAQHSITFYWFLTPEKYHCRGIFHFNGIEVQCHRIWGWNGGVPEICDNEKHYHLYSWFDVRKRITQDPDRTWSEKHLILSSTSQTSGTTSFPSHIIFTFRGARSAGCKTGRSSVSLICQSTPQSDSHFCITSFFYLV